MTNIKLMSYEDFEELFPNNSMVDINKMNIDQFECYRQMYTLYRELVSKYLIEKLNLKQYDNMINNNPLNYKKVDIDKMDIYQKFNSRYLNYFYIRNNIYLEHLSRKEYDFLFQKLNSENVFSIDDNTLNFLEQTYKKVIFEDALGNGNIVYVNYGPETIDFIAPNNSIIIGIRYDMYDNSENLDNSSWDTRFLKQQDYITSLLKRMYDEYKNKEILVNIIQYDVWSIKKNKLVETNLNKS